MTAIWRYCLLLLLLISVQCSVQGQDDTAQGSTVVDVEVGGNSEQQFETPSVHPFFEAVVRNDIEGIDALLKEGVTVDYQNENGWTPAIFAVEYHNYDSLLKIIDSGADLNVQENDGWTALMFAAFHGDGAMIDLLLDHNSNPIQSNIHGALPYQIARAQQHLSEASVLQDAALVRAMELDEEQLVMDLIRDEGRVNLATRSSGWTPLIFFAERGLHDQCVELIGIGAEVNQPEADGWNALLFAASNGHIQVVADLLESGANVNFRARSGATALSKALEGGHNDIVKLLLARGATEKGEETFHAPRDEEGNEQEQEQADGTTEATTDPDAPTDTETAEVPVPEAPAAEEDPHPTPEAVGEPVQTADSITHDPNPPGELDLTRKAVEEDFAKHKKRKGLFFW